MRPDGYPCVFYGDLYGCGGENPQPGVAQLEDIIRSRKLFAYGEHVDYWDHGECERGGWLSCVLFSPPDPFSSMLLCLPTDTASQLRRLAPQG